MKNSWNWLKNVGHFFLWFFSVKSGKIWGKCKCQKFDPTWISFSSPIALQNRITNHLKSLNCKKMKFWLCFVCLLTKIQKSKQMLRARVVSVPCAFPWIFSVFFIKTKTGYKKWGLLSLKGETKGKKCFNEISYIIWQKVWDPDGKWNRHCLHN